MGRCLSPCDGTVALHDYEITVESLRRTLDSSPARVTEAIRERMSRLAATERFEEATAHRNRMTAFLRAAARSQRLRAITSCPEVVAARRNDAGAWEVHVVRYGRLAAAGAIPAAVSAREWVAGLQSSAETVVPGPGPTPAATAEESERLLRWLEQPGVRLVHIDGVWSCPIDGAESLRQSLDAIEVSRESIAPFATI
jgi:DNA polymerase-3 subunit epsilon